MESPTGRAAEPCVSVLLPVYNGGKYLREAVESVLTQTYRDFELLALDDGSTDDSLATLKTFAACDDRVRVSARENRGLVATLNDLVALARGRYLARIDADDVCEPMRFAEQIRFLDGHLGHVLVGTWVEHINAKGQRIGIIKGPTDHAEIEQTHLSGHSSVWHPAAMMRKRALLDVGGYRSAFFPAEDLDLWLRLGEIGLLANLPASHVRYRIHDLAICSTHRAEQREAARKACEEAWQRRGVQGRFDATANWREGSDTNSQHDYALQYGWMAWRHRHRGTSLSYLWRALRRKPWSIRSWRLAYGLLFKAPPGSLDREP
jgi:glycosyltransferase involved in cell wall biosynthesis